MRGGRGLGSTNGGQNDGDIIVPARRVGIFDQGCGNGLQIRCLGQHLANLIIGQHAGEAIRAQKKNITGQDPPLEKIQTEILLIQS